MRRGPSILAVACGLVAAGPVWARHPGDPIKPGHNLFSKFQDIQLGQAAAFQVRQQYQVVPNPFLQDYVKRIGDRLAATPEARQSGFSYSFTLLNVPQVNAFALPGGPMFVFSGLLNATENEAQLAGVMAHEMSHVILRHGTHEASKAVAVKTAAALLGAAASARAPASAQLTQLGLGFGANSFILHFSREAETEADLLGTHLMAEAGYNPLEMAHFFEKLAASGARGLQFFSDHPNPENREREIETEIRGLPRREYGYETGDFARAHAQTLAIVPPSAAPPGAVARGPVASAPSPPPPAIAWQQFRGPQFVLSYPANWAAGGDERALRWTLAPRESLVKDSRGAVQVSLGVIISYFHPILGRNDLGTVTLELAGYLHGERPNLQLSATGLRSLRVDGADARFTMLADQSAAAGPQTGALLAVARPEGVFYVLCLAPQRNFLEFQGIFQRMLDSLRFPN